MRLKLSRTAGMLVLASALTIDCFSSRTLTDANNSTATCQVPENTDVDGSTVVFIRGYAFHPSNVHVRRGTRVTWINCETAPAPSHTTTSDASAWTSPLIPAGEAFTTSMDVAGTFTYHCEPHPFMTGSIVVE